MGGIDGIPLDDLDLFTQQATVSVALLNRKLKTAIAFIAEQGQASAEWVKGTEFEILRICGADGAHCADKGKRQRAQGFLKFHRVSSV